MSDSGTTPGPRRVPRHAQVAETLRGRIDDREILPGAGLPSEKALSESFGASRSVIRQALATLEAEGLISKSQGRGTIVSGRAERHRDPARSAGLSSQMRGLGARTATTVLTYRVETPPTQVRHLEGAQALRLERLRYVDDEPVAFIRTWLPADLADALPADCLRDASLHELMTERAGIRIASGTREVRATAARAPIDAHLGVDPGFPLLLLEGESFDQHGRVVEVFSTWHRSDRVAFDVSLAPTEAIRAGEETPEDRVGRLRALLAEAQRELDALDEAERAQ